jgi:hypothetical protein
MELKQSKNQSVAGKGENGARPGFSRVAYPESLNIVRLLEISGRF